MPKKTKVAIVRYDLAPGVKETAEKVRKSVEKVNKGALHMKNVIMDKLKNSKFAPINKPPLDVTPKKGESQNDATVRVLKEKGYLPKEAKFMDVFKGRGGRY